MSFGLAQRAGLGDAILEYPRLRVSPYLKFHRVRELITRKWDSIPE